MRPIALLFMAVLAAAPAGAQPAGLAPSERQQGEGASTSAEPKSTAEDGTLPVSLDKINKALQQPAPLFSLRTVDERPTFRVQIIERQKIDELLATLNFKTAPAPGGGLYGYEMQRQMWPAVDNPMMQPYAAFNQGELLTILVENLVRKYLGDRLGHTVSKLEREHAEAAARDEVRRTIAEYCSAQPRGGAGIVICSTESAAPR